jgi:hypothetical protein
MGALSIQIVPASEQVYAIDPKHLKVAAADFPRTAVICSWNEQMIRPL